MAERDIIQNMILQLGQSQTERTPAELDAHYVEVDERTTEDLLRFAREFSRSVNFYPADSEPSPLPDWSRFFDYDDATIRTLIEQKDGRVPPHLALFQSFLELYRTPREVINSITGRHLDFYYRQVLRQQEQPMVPDRAHVVLELKKGASPVAISTEHLFSGGRDVSGVELIYAPLRESVINASGVDSLCSIFVDAGEKGIVRAAPVANSSDGLGGEFGEGESKWAAFGNARLPAGEVGFAIASPVLRMKEGIRTVKLRLILGSIGSGISNESLRDAFELFITGEKSWLGPFTPTASLVAAGENVLELDFTLPEKEAAVVDYNAAVHGYAYATQSPVVQVLLHSGTTAIGYHSFDGMTVQDAEVSVEVSTITSLQLESDAGTLDPRKAFMPFGSQPGAGSRFMIGSSEALSKKLTSLSLTIQWKDVPGNLASYYSAYFGAGEIRVTNDSFSVTADFRDGGGWSFTGSKQLFEADARAPHIIAFEPGVSSQSPLPTPGRQIYALTALGSNWSLREAARGVRIRPVFSAFRFAPPPARDGFITFMLNRDFLHAAYRKKYVQSVLEFTRNGTGNPAALNEPYTPVIQSISLTYKAHSGRVRIGSATLDDFAGGDVEFFHVTPFGQRREHGFLRAQFEFITDKNVSLLPVYQDEGELLIGLGNLQPGDSASLLFQVAEGSADPDLPQQPLVWSVLCNNYWKTLGRSELVLDTTNGLLVSGIVGIVIPAESTTDNTLLPTGMIWIKVAVRQQAAAVSQLIDVVANAVEVRFIDRGNDIHHVERALPAGRIAKLKKGIAEVKSISQPYASFGGSPAETSAAFNTRVSERLRHKNRCITAWDYERIVLQGFPRVHRVKCVPHASGNSWMAPGHLLIVVVPDLRNQNATDPLQPRVDANTISRIRQHVQERAGMGVQVTVRNPRYQKIHLDFKVRFHDGYEFNFYQRVLQQELIRMLSPWAFDGGGEPSFGGTIYKSVLLDFIEERDYVDYVTDFQMQSYSGQTNNLIDISEVRAETPDTILVSDFSHRISRTSEA